jgi:hypothetical protein
MRRLDRQFHDGVADSLERLKRAAEERARQAGTTRTPFR